MPSFEDIFHSRGNDIGRLLALSDGVFAVAITLLVLELRIPDGTTIEHLPQALLDLIPGTFSYVLSFVVIGTYWSAHHRIFSYIRRYDAGLVRINTLLLLSISFIPLPTGIIGRYFSAPAAVVLYAASMALTGTIILLLWWYATNHHRLVDEDLDSDIIRFFTTRFLFPPIIFLLSIPLAFVNIFNPALSGSSLAAYFWVVLALLLNLHAIIYRRWMKVRPQDFQGDAPEAASVPPAAKKTQEGERAPEQTE